MKTNIRVLWTLLLCVMGVVLAVPVSYFFQIDVMRIMSLWDYVSHFPSVQLYSAPLGAWRIYINTAIVLVLLFIIGFNALDYHRQKNQKQ